MRILFLSFYFEPDLCAGSFRNTALFQELRKQLPEDGFIYVLTTLPNRYKTYKASALAEEKGANYVIRRIGVPEHKGGMADQAKSFSAFYRESMRLVKGEHFDLVYASSSRLFTAFLGRRIADKMKCPLYLDIRDIFVDTMKDVLNRKPLLQKPVIAVAKMVERYTFSHATHINLVSEGFKEYFKRYKTPSYSFFTNGIDDVFLNVQRHKEQLQEPNPIIITYAGNMGSGQGLEKIVPQAAKLLGNRYLFRLIGDGGTKKVLQQKLKELEVTNVELLNPVPRNELLEYYAKSTFLFLHLNDLEAFKKVLPSKLFEYGAFDNPIIAGVGGYAAQFIKEHLSNYILFKPTDVDDLVDRLKRFTIKYEVRTEFRERFARKAIMERMATDILKDLY